MSYERDFKDLPEGWKWARLGEVCKNLKAGGTPARDMLDYWGGNIPFALVEDLTKNKYLTSTSETITEKGLKNSSAWIVPKNSILISIYASLGEVAINKIDTSTNQAILGMILKENYDLEFIYYLLKFNKNNFEKFTTQTTQKNLNKKIVSELKFALPTSLPEQQKIAEILETIDNAIEKTDKIIEKYKRIKQGLMQDLLTKGIDENGNIRSEKTHKFKDSPLGRIPEEWEVVRLGEVVEKIRNGYVYSFQQIKKEGIPITRIESISEGYIDENKVGYLDLTHIELVKDFKLEVGDILFSHINSLEHVGKTAIYKGKPSFLIHGMNLLLLRTKKSICSPFFLIYVLKSEEVRGKIRNLSRQAVNQVSVNTFDLYNLKLILPPLPEQQRLAEILSQIDQTIEKEEQYKEKLQKIKQGLMQDLLTGKVRVNKLLEVENNELPRT